MSAHFRWTLPERNSDATVQAFRSEMLDGNLLQRDEVAGWVAQKAMDDRRLAPHQPPVYDQNFLYYAEPNRIEKFLPTISNT